MKHYVITIMDNKKSVSAADRCIRSGSSVGGVDIEKWTATTPRDDLDKIIADNKIIMTGFDEVWSRSDNCRAAFLSHFSLWQESVRLNQEVTIFEHDAVCINNVNSTYAYSGALSLGAPSYGKFNTPTSLGVVPLQSKPYFPGAHAYRVKPRAAQMLIDHCRLVGAKPTDVFLDIRTFSFLQEYYPWPVEAKDTFTTIQNENGIKAKHNKVEIIEA
jgi:GR25 family glycosyltransferase involved in LPS biosynthesis|tara:strand:+ start:3296 stop:3943 length:648 start_codon:yes stop_codon:yes gene_type:complete